MDKVQTNLGQGLWERGEPLANDALRRTAARSPAPLRRRGRRSCGLSCKALFALAGALAGDTSDKVSRVAASPRLLPCYFEIHGQTWLKSGLFNLSL